MSTTVRLCWCVCLIVAGTVGAVFLPLALCVACDVGACVVALIGPREQRVVVEVFRDSRWMDAASVGLDDATIILTHHECTLENRGRVVDPPWRAIQDGRVVCGNAGLI